MKVLSQLLGRYSEHNKPFILFRLPDTDVLLYRLSDIKPLFNIPTFSFKKATYKNCFRDHEDTYLDTNVLGDLAHQFNRHLLAELCKLKPNDYNLGLADAILQTFPQFKRAPKEEHIWESVQLPLENMEDVIDRTIKIEPTSPPNIHQVIPEARHAMALDKVLLSSNELKRQSMLESPNKRQRIGTGSSPSQSIESDRDKRPHSLSAVTTGNNSLPLSRQIRKIHSHPVSEVEDTAPITPSNNSKRLSIKHKNSLNLTIFAPSYNEQLTGVRSAPINSNFNRPLPNQPAQQHTKPNYANHGPAVSSTPHNIAPASATIARAPFTHQSSPRRHEFAIPPIVPSQQQPPRSAHPTSRDNKLYQQYVASPSLYGAHHPHSTNNTSSSTTKPQPSSYQRNHESTLAVNAASVPLPPKTPTTNSFAALQRQQYLQPFEHLFDTIETTRTLKSTLDDQIRRSSSLMQTLQTSATTIEGLVRNQVKEAQWEMMSQVEQTIESMVRRVEAMEAKLDRASGISPTKKKQLQRQPELNYQTTSLPSPLPSATREERAVAEDLVAFSKREGTDQHEELQTPPTIVRSQNDIGPQEYHNMLDTLRERLDRLERQIDT